MASKSPSLSWGHININVRNLDASIGFYQKLGFSMLLPGIPYLGLGAAPGSDGIPESAAIALDIPATSRGRACIMQLDDGFPKLDLTEWSGTKQRDPLGNADLGLVRFCLGSQSLARDYAALMEQGVEFLSAPQPTLDGKADIAVCVDPDGTLIELIELHLDKW
jgi:catechol 2,3-dioxygenase-like lactoylglutathione lyase family enzyme